MRKINFRNSEQSSPKFRPHSPPMAKKISASTGWRERSRTSWKRLHIKYSKITWFLLVLYLAMDVIEIIYYYYYMMTRWWNLGESVPPWYKITKNLVEQHQILISLQIIWFLLRSYVQWKKISDELTRQGHRWTLGSFIRLFKKLTTYDDGCRYEIPEVCSTVCRSVQHAATYRVYTTRPQFLSTWRCT